MKSRILNGPIYRVVAVLIPLLTLVWVSVSLYKRRNEIDGLTKLLIAHDVATNRNSDNSSNVLIAGQTGKEVEASGTISIENPTKGNSATAQVPGSQKLYLGQDGRYKYRKDIEANDFEVLSGKHWRLYRIPIPAPSQTACYVVESLTRQRMIAVSCINLGTGK